MLQLIDQTGGSPVTLEMVKAHLRLDHSEEDEYLLGVIEMAVQRVEAYLEKALLTRRYRYVWQRSPESMNLLSKQALRPQHIPLKMGPVREIASVLALKEGGEKKKIRYMVDWRGTFPTLLIGQDHQAVEVTYEAGYGVRPFEIPAPIRQAILETVAEFYDNRGGGEVPSNRHIKELLQPYKCERLG